MITTEPKILQQLDRCIHEKNIEVKKKLMETTRLKIIISVAARLSTVLD